MLATFAAATILGAQYGFDPGVKANYDVQVIFDGFLPILGGNTGKADVTMGVLVQGTSQASNGAKSVASELTAFALKFNGGKLPLDLASAQSYFPKTTISMTPQGKVLKTDAPDIALPVKLPGLDVKRFPEITYLPIELSADDMAVGAQWSFTRLFGDSPMDYQCEVKSITGDLATIAVSVNQAYEVLEDETLEIVKNEKDAVNRVSTVLKGSGTVIMDLKRGLATTVDMKNHSISKVTPTKGGAGSERVLDSTLTVRLKGAAGTSSAGSANTTTKTTNPSLWDRAVQTAQDVWTQGSGYVQLARLGLRMVASYFPTLAPFIKLIGG